MDFVPKISDLPKPISPRLVRKEPRIEAGATIFKRFILLNKLGDGRCSSSWLVEDPRFRRDVVLKLFRSASEEESPEERTIWRDFLRRLRILNHPDIVITMEYFHEGSWLALSSTYETGPNLATISVLEGKKLPLPQALAILKTVGSAIAAAHDKCLIVHGNLNAANILVPTRRSSAKITDFGFHPPLPQPGDVEINPDLVWKIACLSPERLRGSSPSHADDIYAYGAVAFQLFTGRNPPLNAAGELDREAADALLGDAPPEWRKLLPTTLATEPTDRPRMLSTLLQELDIYEEFEPGKIDFVHAQAEAQNQERLKAQKRNKPRDNRSPDTVNSKGRALYRLAMIASLIAAPLIIGLIFFHNLTTERHLEAERYKAEIAEKALEAADTKEVLDLNDRLSNTFTPSKASMDLYRQTMTAPAPTPRPTPLNPNSGAIDFLKEGQAKMAEGNPSGAMESYELAIVLQSDWPELLEARGLALLANNKPNDAALEFSKALIIEPTRVASLIGRAKARLATKAPADAKTDLQAALKAEPENVEAKELLDKNKLQLSNEPGVIQ